LPLLFVDVLYSKPNKQNAKTEEKKVLEYG